MDAPLTVTQFNQRVSAMVNANSNIMNIRIIGEISGLSKPYNGTFYFVLKDSNSIISCILRSQYSSKLKFELKNGIKVIALGNANYFIRDGKMQFAVIGMDPEGSGDQQLALEKLTYQLMSEGLFDEARKRKPPAFPRVIGVVTSPSGEAVKDVIKNLADRFPVDILISPALVQGTEAPASIVHAIELLETQNVDVMIVGRGGGSSEDLSAFNDERVVRAVANCKIPVVSAVGHTGNVQLCDRVADRSAPTPSSAAVSLTNTVGELNNEINSLWIRLNNSLMTVTKSIRDRFENLDRRLSPKNARDAVDHQKTKADSLSMRLNNVIDRLLKNAHTALDNYNLRLDPKRMMEKVDQQKKILDDTSMDVERAISDIIEARKRDIKELSVNLESLNPSNVLSRGYSFIKDTDGNVITSVNNLSIGADVSIAMRDGTALAQIKELKKDE